MRKYAISPEIVQTDFRNISLFKSLTSEMIFGSRVFGSAMISTVY